MTTSYRRLVLHPFVVLLMLVAMVIARLRHPQPPMKCRAIRMRRPSNTACVDTAIAITGRALPAPCRRIRSLTWSWFPMRLPPKRSLPKLPTD